ncbi:MAG TPA: TetR/AcrR family transcriptional regulator [bacterium]|nr:TetR/AcrR family transcriptional regulator [bacterium]
MARDQRNREKLIETAAALFRFQGFRPTSLDEILDRSGVCRSNFYYHFRSKDDLGLEVLSRQVEHFATKVIRGILEDESRSPRERVERLFTEVGAAVREASYRGGCPFGNLAAEMAGGHPEFRSRLSGFFSQWEEAVERCLADGISRGQFRRDLDVRGAAVAVVSQIEGAVLLAKTHGHGGPLEAAARQTLKFLESR